ncbi:MAG: response regulator transcription factor [Calditrichota bacterium]
MIRLFIADDHNMFREMLKDSLSHEPDIVIKGEANNGEEALRKLFESDYDVVILDIAMPRLNGLEVLSKLIEAKPESKVLILSMYSEEQYAIRAFEAGASGYITKNEATKELVSAIHKIARGEKYIKSEAATKLVFQMTHSEDKDSLKKLSKREYEIMLLIASGKSVKQIAQKLKLSVSTVSTLKKRVLIKMDMKDASEITEYVIKEGLLS